jgi:hypothetical protein
VHEVDPLRIVHLAVEEDLIARGQAVLGDGNGSL